MSNSLHRIGTSYVIPARPYRAPTPGYYYVRTVGVYNSYAYSWSQAAPYFARNPETGQAGLYWEGSSQTNLGSYNVGTRTELVYVPPIPGDPGAPAQRTDFPPMGWTSFARSIASTMPGGRFRFSPTKPATGIAIGATPYAASPTTGYTHIRHGLLFTGGEVRSLRTGAFYGVYSLGDEFSLTTGPTVVFAKNGSQIGTETSILAAGEVLYLGAAFYAAGDSVDDPAIEALFGGTSTAGIPTLQAASSDAVHAESLAVFPQMVTESGVLARSEAVLPGLVGASSQVAFAQSQGALAALEATSYGGTLVIVPTNTSSALLAPPAASSLLLVGEIGGGDANLVPMVGLSSDREYGESHATMAPLEAITGGMVFGMASGVDFFLFGVEVEALTISTADARDSFEFDIPMTATPMASADARDSFEITVAVTAIGDSQADGRDVFWFDVPLLVADEDGDCWAVNLDGFGSTTYSGYPFNSFANIGGRYFGASAGGIHELEGDTDAGAPIRASVDFGVRDFGASLKKTVSEVYLGMSSTGHLFIKILAEGREYVYRTRSYSEHMQQQRVTLGKGLRPNYAGLQLFNENGADFALDSVEFVPVTMSRRI